MGYKFPAVPHGRASAGAARSRRASPPGLRPERKGASLGKNRLVDRKLCSTLQASCGLFGGGAGRFEVRGEAARWAGVAMSPFLRRGLFQAAMEYLRVSSGAAKNGYCNCSGGEGAKRELGGPNCVKPHW